jgi:hypothetical protein
LNVNGTSNFTGSGAIGGNVLVSGTYNGGGNIGGALTANAGSAINVGGISGGATATAVSAATVDFSAAGTRTMNIDFTGTSADRITVTTPNGLTLGGTTSVVVSPGAAGWVTGTYPIFNYAGAVQGTGASTLALQTAAGHSTLQIVDNGSGAINLHVTGVDVKWVGNNGLSDELYPNDRSECGSGSRRV